MEKRLSERLNATQQTTVAKLEKMHNNTTDAICYKAVASYELNIYCVTYYYRNSGVTVYQFTNKKDFMQFVKSEIY